MKSKLSGLKETALKINIKWHQLLVIRLKENFWLTIVVSSM